MVCFVIPLLLCVFLKCKDKQTTRTAFDATSNGMSIGQNTPPKMESGGRNTHHLNLFFMLKSMIIKKSTAR
ncbi:unnamed protein product [Cuscuta campestris]|uniref:Secreted protein n=1 Tax=Cuscuta campestris TaxID=132261 RepID=A0A484KX26_9ASTE|nr:unnamed protein product [Cuscuta campestris]